MKTGVIDVGGGLRGSFGCGVLDRCLDDGAAIDYGIGVSAGSANILSFFAGQKGRNFTYYTEYAFRREYLSFRNMVRKHNYLDLDYVYSTLSDSDGEYPLDYRSAKASGKEYYAVACDAVTGKPRYFTFGDGLEQDRYDALKASCCVPIACQPYRIDGVPYVDGGLADPVPVKKALDDGCSRIILILTKPKEHIGLSRGYRMSARWLDRKGVPNAADGMRRRPDRYNEGLDYVLEMEKKGAGLVVAPDSVDGMKTLKRDREAIRDLYQQGYEAGGKIKAFLEQSTAAVE
jgi:predicted patatin/cPLA2 family phospholipase